MIHLQLAELIHSRKQRWGRRITLTEISARTGISRMTLNRMMHQQGYSTVTDHLDKLCTYFECEINELVKFIPNTVAANVQNIEPVAA
jgi:putative transcriptional regulator